MATPKAIYKSNDLKKIELVQRYDELNGHITNACAAVGIDRSTYYKWIHEDEEFAKAIQETELHLNDEIRNVLVTKAGEGDMTAVIFYLKNRHPDFKQQAPTTLIQQNFYEKTKGLRDEYED